MAKAQEPWMCEEGLGGFLRKSSKVEPPDSGFQDTSWAALLNSLWTFRRTLAQRLVALQQPDVGGDAHALGRTITVFTPRVQIGKSCGPLGAGCCRPHTVHDLSMENALSVPFIHGIQLASTSTALAFPFYKIHKEHP